MLVQSFINTFNKFKNEYGRNMLYNLHVKNLAIIDEIEVTFDEGFNILTGETGAGK